MTDHLHYIKNAVLKSYAQLKQDLETSIAGTGDPLGPNTLDVRQANMVFDHTPVSVRRVYIQVNDSSSLSSVGWVTNESVQCCMECLKTFSIFTRRHHCRTCGAVNCSECCSSWATIRDFGDLGTVRVCFKCNPKGESEVRLQNNITWGESILSKAGDSTPDGKSGYESRLSRLGIWSRISRAESGAAALPPVSPISVIAAAAEQAAAEMANVERVATLRREEDAENIEAAHGAMLAQPETVNLVPFPGFVIKTHRRNAEESKVFINVFHHTMVKDEHMMLTYMPYDATLIAKAAKAGGSGTPRTAPTTGESYSSTAQAAACPTVPAGPAIEEVPLVTPLVYVAVDRSCTQDKEGYVSLLYNVLVSSAYFERNTVAETDMHVAHPCSVNKIIQIVNQRYKDCLYEDQFVLPKVRMRYHGPAITKPIPFKRADVPVRYVDISELCYTAHGHGTGTGADGSVAGEDTGSVASRPVSGSITSPVLSPAAATAAVTAALPPAPLSRHNSAGKLLRPTPKGRVSPCVTAGGVASIKDTPEPDEQSIVSDITVASNLSTSDAVFVRERRRFAFTKSRHVRGEMVITDEMLRLNARQTMSLAASEGLKDRSLADPSTLIGYQIVMPYNTEIAASFEASRSVPMVEPSFIYVIIDTAKNNLRKTEYKVTNHVSGDAWVRLKRGKTKVGVEFRILRKVLQDPALSSPSSSAKTLDSPVGIAGGGFGGFGIEDDSSVK